MSTPFYDLASLVVVPSGYKASKVYAQKPLTTDGQLAFTRSTTATRVGPDGLIEKVRTNLSLYSEDWTNWTLFQSTATANTTANPLTGTLTADTLTISTSTYGVSYRAVSTGLNVATFSAYLKAGTHNFAQIGFTDSTDYAVNVNLTLGTIVGVSSGMTGTITSVGSGWYRVTATRTIATTSTPNAFVNIISGTVGSTIIVYGGQVELGDIATPYIATTSAAVSVGPVANVPRLDYLGSSCPRLLLEPQRQNLFLQSEAINNAAWNAARYTRTANQTASPSGYVDADQCTPTATTGTHEIFPATGISFSATAYTMSLFAKYNGYNISLGVAGDSSNWTGCVFDLQNGIAKTPQSAGSQSVCTAKIEDYGSGWYRCSITFTPYTTPTFYPTFGAVNSANATLGAWGAQEFTANGTSGTYLWGCQLEAGAYATSYIPTLGASVTRGADACSKTGISSLIGQTEGTIFIDFVWRNSLTDVVPFDITGSDGKLIWMRDVGAQFYGNGTTLIADIGRTGAVQGTRYKIAFVYGQNDFRLYRNGSLIGTDTSGTFTGTFSDIALNSVINQANGFNQILLFKTKLTNAQLAELTA